MLEALRTCCAVAEAAAEVAGIEGVGAHTLRHSVAVGWLESSVHIVDGWSGVLGL